MDWTAVYFYCVLLTLELVVVVVLRIRWKLAVVRINTGGFQEFWCSCGAHCCFSLLRWLCCMWREVLTFQYTYKIENLLLFSARSDATSSILLVTYRRGLLLQLNNTIMTCARQTCARQNVWSARFLWVFYDWIWKYYILVYWARHDYHHDRPRLNCLLIRHPFPFTSAIATAWHQ